VDEPIRDFVVHEPVKPRKQNSSYSDLIRRDREKGRSQNQQCGFFVAIFSMIEIPFAELGVSAIHHCVLVVMMIVVVPPPTVRD